MKICFIGPAKSTHIIKWCKYFVDSGNEVHVVSFDSSKIEHVKVHYISTGVDIHASTIKKIKYLFFAYKLRKIALQLKPDIINVHYATSYGGVAALSGLKNYFLSVWGSDVYDFPQKSVIHEVFLKFCLKKAKYILSTSNAMANETSKYTKKKIEITPFGVDISVFNPEKRNRIDDDFIVGTVKGLSYTYGIDYLIRAVALIRKKHPEVPIKLRIAGKGPEESVFKQFAFDCGISDITSWLGFISQEQAAIEWANMDVAIIPSILESFGVSAVEAQACGVPVIISDVPGLMEATKPGYSSIVVSKENAEELAKEIINLYFDTNKRREYGLNGIKFVKENYEYEMCFSKISHIFANEMRK